ncbi:MAG: MaoC family dehydratase N-terminal domain-containing protein [Rhizobiaceae bacterium]|nr:MaoC family dehydratase N-terminal domain-containing protein [Rhizobiaceae bacterium]
MNNIDIAHLRSWIGNSQHSSDIITPGLVERFRATFGNGLADTGAAAPLGVHWCLSQPAAMPDMLGPDGHPARGGFLPPVPLPRRMWAGGSIKFHAPLPVGGLVTRESRIADVTEKSGRSGSLVFLTVAHEVSTDAGLAISERQDIVYRDVVPGASTPYSAGSAPASSPADLTETVEATTTLLFRYSAITFNGHRIHYDRDYARDVEGYPGLVVHGPLQATLLLNLASRAAGGRLPASFSYRGVSPLFDGASFTINAVRESNGFDLWCGDQHGLITMDGRAEFVV